jgi:mercuric ion binding protein
MRRIFSVSTMLMMAFPAHGGEPQRVVLDVPGMNCTLCPISVKKALERVPGVVEAKADLASKTAEATIDPKRTSPAALSKAVSNAGYPATVRRR